MKLHLPIALLAAVVGAMSFAQANNTPGSYEYSVSGEPGYFTQDTSIHFTGDWTNVNFENKAGMGDGDYGYNGNSDVGGLLPVNGTGTANNVNVKVGSDDCATNIGTVIGVGPAGYAAIGNKVITVTGSSDVNAGNYTYVGAIIGANNISATSANGYVSGTYEVTGVCDSVIKFAKKTGTDKNITINVEGGSVGQIRGGGSGHSGKIDTAIAQAWKHYSAEHAKKSYATDAARQSAIRKDVEAFVADGPWMRNEQIYITVGGNSKVGYKADGVTDYEIGGEAAIYGAGGTAHSVNNDVNITVTDNAVINGNVLGGAVANTYDISGYEATAVNSSVNNTHITITGDSKVDGNVYGGGWSKKTTSTAIVKGNTEVVLEGGTVTGDVYGAGHGDHVEGNTKVVIKGEGATVNGTIYGGGENGANVKGDKILAFEEYTAGGESNGYQTISWTKDNDSARYEGFDTLEVVNTKMDLENALDTYKKLNISAGADVVASAPTDGGSIRLNAEDSALTINGNLTINGSSVIKNTDLTAAGDGSILTVENKASMKGGSLSAENVVVSSPNFSTPIEVDSVTAENVTVNKGRLNTGDLNVAAGGTIKNEGFLVVSNETVLDNVKVTNNSASTASGYIVMKGDVTAKNGTSFETSKGSINFRSEVIAESGTKFTTTGGKISFDTASNLQAKEGSEINVNSGEFEIKGTATIESDVTVGKGGLFDSNEVSTSDITVKGNTFTNNGGTVNFGKIQAEDATFKANAGGINFKRDTQLSNCVVTNTMSKEGTGNVSFNGDVELVGNNTFTSYSGSTQFSKKLTVNGNNNFYGGTQVTNMVVNGGTQIFDQIANTEAPTAQQTISFNNVSIADGSDGKVIVKADEVGIVRFNGECVINELYYETASGLEIGGSLTVQDVLKINGQKTYDGITGSYLGLESVKFIVNDIANTPTLDFTGASENLTIVDGSVFELVFSQEAVAQLMESGQHQDIQLDLLNGAAFESQNLTFNIVVEGNPYDMDATQLFGMNQFNISAKAGTDLTIHAVPEPTTATLSLLALAALAARRRRK